MHKSIILSLLFISACGGGLGKKSSNKNNGSSGQTATECHEVLAQNDCTANKISGKTCIWVGNGCIEDTAEQKDFRSKARGFSFEATDEDPEAEATAAKKKTIWGQRHGETPDWNILCKRTGSFGNMNNVQSIFFGFTGANNDEVEIHIKCGVGTTAPKGVHLFKYRLLTTADKHLKIILDLNNKDLQGSWDSKRTGNLLEFFSKADLLYVKNTDENKDRIIVIHQLGKFGYQYQTIPLDTLSQFKQAIDYQKQDSQNTGNDDGYNIAKDAGAISYYLKHTTALP